MRGGVFWTWRNALANVPRTPDPQPAAVGQRDAGLIPEASVAPLTVSIPRRDRYLERFPEIFV
jgi:hypothetical protein